VQGTTVGRACDISAPPGHESSLCTSNMDWSTKGNDVLPSLGSGSGATGPARLRGSGLAPLNSTGMHFPKAPQGDDQAHGQERSQPKSSHGARDGNKGTSGASWGQQMNIGKLPQQIQPLADPQVAAASRQLGGHSTAKDEPQSARQTRSSGGPRDSTAAQSRGSVTARPSSKGAPSWATKPGDFGSQKTDNGEKADKDKEKEKMQTQLPMTPAKALKFHMEDLTEYEQGEILDFPQVWFLGSGAQKIRGTSAATNNHSYDDERGDYFTVLHDHILYRYEVTNPLGKGSFGQVVRVFDFKANTYMALKIIRNKKRFHHQALVEVKILEHLRERDVESTSNVVHMQDYFYFRNHLCITFELLSINLYEFIKNNNFQGVSLGLIRRFAIQLLAALRFLRKLHIIHCDLKPENVLLKNPTKSGIKVIDFGSSCFEDERVYTYIQSRFYRAPEIILGIPYDVAIDMWSFGCILAELYTGYPLFPGENEVEQLACIMEICAAPPEAILETATRIKMFFDSNKNPRLVPNSRGKVRRPGSKDMQMALRTSETKYVDFLQGCLQWDPRERFTPEDALQQEWILEGYARHAASKAEGGRSGDGHSSSAHASASKPSSSSVRRSHHNSGTRGSVGGTGGHGSHNTGGSHGSSHGGNTGSHAAQTQGGIAGTAFSFPPIESTGGSTSKSHKSRGSVGTVHPVPAGGTGPMGVPPPAAATPGESTLPPSSGAGAGSGGAGGKPLAAPKCLSCGQIYMDDANFCRKCGKPRMEDAYAVDS